MKHLRKLEQGKQGVTGLLEENGVKYVYKISQYMNFLIEHEYAIMNRLEVLNQYCPHFCRVVKVEKLPIHPNFTQLEQDPFEKSDKPLFLNVLFIEYIEKSTSFFDLISDQEIPFHILMSILKQVMVAVVMAQEYKFVHYDLHSMNILMTFQNNSDVHVYKLKSGEVLYVPTYGFVPVIIDFGFASIDSLKDNPLYCSISYTDAGYLSPIYDSLADSKNLLVSVCRDLKEFRDPNEPEIKLFRNMVKNFFFDLPINWNSGWDVRNEPSLADQLFSYIENPNEESRLFTKYPHFCIDILHSLITIPLKPQVEPNLKKLRKYYEILVSEFLNIEKEVGKNLYSLYIFRQTVELARELREMYLTPETKEKALLHFQREVFEMVSKIAKFCSLKQVNYERLLCSLYAFQEQLETQLYFRMDKLLKQKNKEYKKMPVKNIKQMLFILQYNLRHVDKHSKITDQTNIYLWDQDRKVGELYQLNEEYAKLINKSASLKKGETIYNILQLKD